MINNKQVIIILITLIILIILIYKCMCVVSGKNICYI